MTRLALALLAVGCASPEPVPIYRQRCVTLNYPESPDMQCVCFDYGIPAECPEGSGEGGVVRVPVE